MLIERIKCNWNACASEPIPVESAFCMLKLGTILEQ